MSATKKEYHFETTKRQIDSDVMGRAAASEGVSSKSGSAKWSTNSERVLLPRQSRDQRLAGYFKNKKKVIVQKSNWVKNSVIALLKWFIIQEDNCDFFNVHLIV